MGALVKNGDLVPDCEGRVTKQQTKAAMLRVGLTTAVTVETTDGNFDHAHLLEGKFINLFEMNAKPDSSGKVEPVGGALEHFRSTGIRDTDVPDEIKMNSFEHACATGEFFNQNGVKCGAMLWDMDPGHRVDMVQTPFTSNDIFEQARPTGCNPNDSGANTSACLNSALYGAITNMFLEFGEPPQSEATTFDKTKWRDLFLKSEYPSEFLQRSPRSCVDVNSGAFGCQKCLNDVPPNATFLDPRSIALCKCLVYKQEVDGVTACDIKRGLPAAQELCTMEEDHALFSCPLSPSQFDEQKHTKKTNHLKTSASPLKKPVSFGFKG